MPEDEHQGAFRRIQPYFKITLASQANYEKAVEGLGKIYVEFQSLETQGRDSGGKKQISPVAKRLYKIFQAATALYERAYSGIRVGVSGLRLRQTRNDAN